MVNPYIFTGPGTRWSQEDPTAEDYMNVSRVNVDHVYTALNLIMDTNADTGLVTGEASLLGASTLFSPSIAGVLTAETAHVGPIPVMLDDPEMAWDLRAAMQQARGTSWYASLGAPPVHGVAWITEDQTTLKWWNIETDTEYLSIVGAVDGIIEDASPVLTDLAFKDFVFYVSGTGGADITIIDLLRDGATKHDTAGSFRYQGQLADFTGTAGYLAMSTAAAQQIVNATVNAVAACRDPAEVDEFGRPKHWWVAGMAVTNSLSIYNPVNDAIYDLAAGYGTVLQSCMRASDSGEFVWASSDATRDHAYEIDCLFKINADGLNPANGSWGNDSPVGSRDIPWTNSAVFSGVDFMPGISAAGRGSMLAFFGSDEGLGIGHYKAGDIENGGLILITSTYNSPYMKGAVVGAWPLEDVNDVSVNAKTLTNNNVVTFTSGVFDNAATFDGVNQYLSRAADAGLSIGGNDWSIAFWFKSASAVNPGGQEYMVQITDSVAEAIDVRFEADGSLYFRASSAGSDVIDPTADMYDATWHHCVYLRSGSTEYAYIDGVLIGSVAVTHAAMTIDDLFIGCNFTPGSFFEGQIDQLVFTIEALTEREIKYMYSRGIAAQNGAATLLTATDVDSIRVDENSGLFIVTAGDVAHIMDERGVIIATDAAPAGTLNDASLYSRQGADTPYLFMGTSTRVEIVAPDVRLQDRR
ncbi:MAG: LamG domain-containing protein [Chloroflexota bacterium]